MPNEHTDNNTITRDLMNDGYVRIPGLLSPELVRRLQKEMKPFFTSYPKGEGAFYGEETVRFGGVFSKSRAAQEIACHPDLLEIVQGVLGDYCDRIQINLTQAIEIHPGETSQILHRDEDMFPFDKGDTECMLNCMIALTPYSAKNGGTRIWPGHHRPRTKLEEIDFTSWIAPELDPGDMLVFLGSTVHGGGANLTDQPRQGLVLSYSVGWLRQSENQYLSYPPEIAAGFPERLQQLVGYQAHRPNLGWFDGQDPSFALQEKDSLAPPSVDLMSHDMTARIRAYKAIASQLDAARSAH